MIVTHIIPPIASTIGPKATIKLIIWLSYAVFEAGRYDLRNKTYF